jgi:hypothetical protein
MLRFNQIAAKQRKADVGANKTVANKTLLKIEGWAVRPTVLAGEFYVSLKPLLAPKSAD